MYGRAPLDPGQLVRLGELVGMNLPERRHVGKVHVTRPERSACLAPPVDADRAAYEEALAISRSDRATRSGTQEGRRE